MTYFNKAVNSIKALFLNSSIKHKMLIVFTAFMLFYICISSVIYINILSRETTSQISQHSHKTTELIRSNINALVQSASNISRIFTINSTVRKYLSDPKPSIELSGSVNEILSNTHITFANIDSIYLYNLYGSCLRSTKFLTFSTVEDITHSPMYKELLDLRGGYKISINAEKTLFSTSGENLISVARVINDIDSLMPIGVLIVNISESSLSDILQEAGANPSSSFVILDADNNSVIKNSASYEIYSPYFPESGDTERIVSINNERYFIYKLDVAEMGWKIIICSSLSHLSYGTRTLNIVYVVFIGITILLFILGSVFTANLITSPIKKLINSMQGVTRGVFKRVSYNTGNDEIGELKNNYNLMIIEINNLIIKLVDEEKQKMKLELGMLNEQIKPHFLYNTLDSIAFLALSDNNTGVYESLNALAGFYRMSLSKGSETISLSDEVKLVKNYLTLQKLRYGEIITDEYNIEGNAMQIKILRNILQPLVENSIYHGIRPGGEAGVIKISAYTTPEYLFISVEDDGIGMDSSEIQSIASGKLEQNQASFGLRGTIRRLSIHYGTDDIYTVESEKYAGTKITLKIPLQGG
ncbi:two-component system sensor histidine kinase YesM [Anaerobacterium chartisolvens]|uniref:Two-component system sensor histidine kinase YesM n=1 Tax=Anaerobacterium chartisolvens TaxID=1297424 RepID=A0A369B4Z9_9FIRM|nr:histidine kinase [Anaerobacterium chartisolvens]RCX16599.1 two-component system sensor histidine kinase YesM [Anaerobacterium chartisolvens]